MHIGGTLAGIAPVSTSRDRKSHSWPKLTCFCLGSGCCADVSADDGMNLPVRWDYI